MSDVSTSPFRGVDSKPCRVFSESRSGLEVKAHEQHVESSMPRKEVQFPQISFSWSSVVTSAVY